MFEIFLKSCTNKNFPGISIIFIFKYLIMSHILFKKKETNFLQGWLRHDPELLLMGSINDFSSPK